jgi:tol-pal system protein YbgF
MTPAVLVGLVALAPAALAGTKEDLARIQSDVLVLQNQMRVLEKSVSEATESLKTLIGQLNDQVAKSTAALTKVSSALEAQTASDRAGSQAVLTEVRNLGGKLDDAAVRISALAQQISDMKVQAKAVNARRFQTMGADTGAIAQSAETVYFEAYNDLVQGNFDLAIQGFTAYVTNYPKSEKADDAEYYIGEAYYNDNKLPQAIAAFGKVVADFASGDRVASALYKRALAEKQAGDKESAISDLRAVVQRFPEAPEAALAQSELESLGAKAPPPRAPARSRR